jgi:hypothetical protein
MQQRSQSAKNPGVITPGTQPRTKSVEEVILVRRTLGALQHQRKSKERENHVGRPSTVGGQRKVLAAPIEMQPRSSVHPMQGSIMVQKPSSANSIGIIVRSSADNKSMASTPAVPHHHPHAHHRIGADKPASSPGMMRSHMHRYGEETLRPVTHHVALRQEMSGSSDNKVEALGAKLHVLAARLQTVDARSQIIEHVLSGDNIGIMRSSSAESPPSPRHSYLSTSTDTHTAGPDAFAQHTHKPPISYQDFATVTSHQHGSPGSFLGRSSGDLARSMQKNAMGTATGPPRRIPASITTAVDSIHSTLANLDYIFLRATGDQKEAATLITKIAKGYICRKRYVAGRAALRSWKQRQSSGMADFFNTWLIDRRHIHAQLKALTHKRDMVSGRRCLLLWAEYAWSVLPTRVDQRQRAYFMAVRAERRLVQACVWAWKEVVSTFKGRKDVVIRNRERYNRIRDKVMDLHVHIHSTYMHMHVRIHP